VETMRRRGVDRLGVVEHAYRFVEARGILTVPWAEARCRYELQPYLDFIFGARADGYPILVGVEMDYVPGREDAIRAFLDRAPWDFVIGSVHVLGDWAVDRAEEAGRWAEADPAAVWDAYHATQIQAVHSGLFDVLAHPDLPKIFGHRPPTPLTRWHRELARALAAAGMAIEVNSAGLRKPVGELYPEADLLVAARAAGVPATVGSDAHTPEEVGEGLFEALAHLARAGYDELAYVAGRRLERAPLPRAGFSTSTS
jgi:histidinol-phosphatase (PHP family)